MVTVGWREVNELHEKSTGSVVQRRAHAGDRMRRRSPACSRRALRLLRAHLQQRARRVVRGISQHVVRHALFDHAAVGEHDDARRERRTKSSSCDVITSVRPCAGQLHERRRRARCGAPDRATRSARRAAAAADRRPARGRSRRAALRRPTARAAARRRDARRRADRAATARACLASRAGTPLHVHRRQRTRCRARVRCSNR